jgi:hypothetical protein
MSTKLRVNPIYKVNHLINENEIKDIYVFYGRNEKLTELFKKDPENEAFIDKSTGKHIFNDEEMKNIKDKNISIHFSQQQIHFDDSIGTIKLKIVKEFSNTFSYEEIYLFCMKEESFNPVLIYQTLTQNKRLELTKTRLDQFLLNIIRHDTGTPVQFNIQEKEIYDYDDILALHLDNKKFWVNKVLGQKFLIITNEYPFVVNPYDAIDYDKFLEKASRKSLSTLNNNLLLNTGEIIENNIFLCLAKDVLREKKDSHEYALKIYYPFLYAKNIISLEDVNNKRLELIEENKKKMQKSTIDTFESIDMFYDIFKDKKTELGYKNSGIKKIKAIIRPDYNIKIPLDIIFKLIHASEENPLIKYNPSSRKEQIYRLYADKISKDGRKIPYLSKASVFKLMKKIGKNKSVAVYIDYYKNDVLYSLVCEFEENGNIEINGEFEKIIALADLNDIIKNAINPIIDVIKTYLEQSGYTINLFESITSSNFEIKQLDYETTIGIDKPIKLDKLRGCLSSAFIMDSLNIKDDIKMRFKRVANFNKRTSQEAFILEKKDEGLRGDEIIEEVVKVYQIPRSEAAELLAKLASELEVQRNVKRNEISIKINPGFKTTIHLNQISSDITIRVENINDIFYLTTIPIYLDTLVRLTQGDLPATTKYPEKLIKKICSSKEKEDVVVEDLVSAFEAPLEEQEVPYLEGDNLEFRPLDEYIDEGSSDESKVKNAISLFYGDDDEEEEEDEFEGGEKDTDSSEKSLSSFDSESPLEEPGKKSSEELEKSSSSLDVEQKPLTPIEESDSLSSVEEVQIPEIKPQEIKQIKSPTPVTKAKIQLEEDSEEEDEEEDEEEPIPAPAPAQAPRITNFVRDINNMSLRNYFQDKISEKEPTLILTEKQGKFNAYSRVCPSADRRQPIILTKEELDKVNEEHPGFLKDEDVINYGSTEDKNFYYVCPRYWNLKTNMIVTPAEMEKNNLYKNLIPKKGKESKKATNDKYIYDFSPAGNTDKDFKQYPSFQVNKHPSGLCLPCCFTNWDTPDQIKRRKLCSGEKKEDGKDEKQKPKQEEEYVKGPEKFPLDTGRWGYLPVPIQKFLHEVNEDCQVSKTNTNVKLNHPCLLRHGVETNNSQSFIACIADALFFTKGDETSKEIMRGNTIKKMKKVIISTLNLDNFITYQNGNLVTDFTEPKREINVSNVKYTSSKLYSKLSLKNNSDLQYFKNVCSAYENFIEFLKDDKIFIDYTYLWDIICKPNEYLFASGINLVILEIPENDITNNVNLICPTNHYSNDFYEARKPTLILMRRGDYFEPIYSYRNTEKALFVGKLFSEFDPQLSSTMRAVFNKLIKPYFQKVCSPLSSISENIYKAKTPLILSDIIDLLTKKKYTILKQVVNYQNKVIGIVAEKTKRGFIPCYPSAINSKFDYVFMIDPSIWSEYTNTIQFLNGVNKDTSGKIACKPEFKVVEDEMIVGVLTQTNQFVQLSKPFSLGDARDEIPILENNNFIVNKNVENMVSIDVPIETSNEVDNERVEYIKKIKLETNFYNVFRNTIRILLNDYENLALRENIEQEMNKAYVIYSKKLESIHEYLKTLAKDTIIFSDDYNYDVISEISTCLVNKNKTKCDSKAPLCAFTTENKCQIILPKKNLITRLDNELLYFGKMADELIRYSRIKSFILEPQSYLSFTNLSYNLNDDEILMIQSMLTQEYFEGLIPAVFNKYVKYNSYDEVEPIQHPVYENSYSLEEATNPKSLNECVTTTNNKIFSLTWRKHFPNTFKEKEYSKTKYCTFYVIIDLIKEKIGKVFDINGIRDELYSEYSKYVPKLEGQILDMMIVQGKKIMASQVKGKKLSFQDMIFSESYYLTTIDYYLLANKFEIPMFFITAKYLFETNFSKREFVAYGDRDDAFSFIVVPGLRAEEVPVFKVIQSADNKSFLKLSEIKNNEDLLVSLTEKKGVQQYLESFTKSSTYVYQKKKPKPILLVVDSDSQKSQKSEAKNEAIVVVAPKKKRTLKEKKVVDKRKSKKNVAAPKPILEFSDSS